jgi:adenine-specific DNA-methyltransferase
MPWLEWLDRKKDLDRAQNVPYRLLEHVPDLSFGDADAGNMLVQGDNLDALKALLPYYAGQVKCIFIDPPYNTQSAFEHYDDNLEHSKWLSEMYPRLELLRRFLREDGSIWITLDDNESHYLKVIADEVFGRKNFAANIVWQKKYTVANDARLFSTTHDHVIVYAKNLSSWQCNRLPRSAEMDARYKNPDKHPKGPWKATPIHAKSGSEAAAKLVYRFKNGVEWSPPPGTFSRYSVATLEAMDANDEIWFGKDGKSMPSRKTFLEDIAGGGIVPATVWMHDEAGHNHEARDEAKRFNPNDPFGTPKPERLLRRILDIASVPGDLIMDSFLGSGTTAAVAHKMGRRWIGIEMGDHAQTHCQPRLAKVVQGEQGGISEAVGWSGGGGFQFYKLGPAVFDEHGRIREDVRFKHLAAHLWFAETGTPRPNLNARSPLLGVHDETAYYLLFNGILGDRRPDSGNVLTTPLLNALPAMPEGAKRRVIFGEATRIGPERLRSLNIQFKQIPYDIHAR